MGNWRLVGSRPACYETGLAPEMLFEGHPVAFLRSLADPDNGFGALQQNAPLQKFSGGRVTLAGALRAEGVNGWAGLWMRVEGGESGKPLAYENTARSPITGTNDWARQAITVDVPAEATNIAYGVILRGQGNLWVADCALDLDAAYVNTNAVAKTSPAGTGSPSRSSTSPTSQRTPRTISGLDVLSADECPTFAQIGGMQTVKDQLNATVGLVLTDPARAANLKISFNGVLLYGPLGTGKSLFARALAGEFGCTLVCVPGGHAEDAPSVLQQRLEKAFEVAHANAPAVLFFDEFDWLVTREDRRPLLNDLLDRVLRALESVAGNPNVIVVATTQAIDNIDPSAIRPGLFDLKIRVGLPDGAARSAILAAQLRDRPTDSSVDVAGLAAATDGLSAAALTAVVNAAAFKALSRKAPDPGALTQTDLLTALRDRGGRDRPAATDWSWDALILPSETKRELQELQRMIEDPGLARRFGVTPPRGALLYGPPGTGKTTIARVLAAQAKSSFYAIKGSDIVSKWLGESEQRVHELFARARENRPSIIFLDEIDALGAARGSADSGAMDRILNQILQEIDGLDSGTGVFVLGATNRRDLLDDALIRGGRLGRQIEIPNPDGAGRLAMLKHFTKAMPLAGDVDIAALAARTEGMSGADLQQLCQQAAIHAMMHATSNTGEITSDDFIAGLEHTSP